MTIVFETKVQIKKKDTSSEYRKYCQNQKNASNNIIYMKGIK